MVETGYEEKYMARLCAAYIRGCARLDGVPALGEDASQEEIIAAGEAAGLKLYHFKNKDILPRVRAVLGFLQGVQPQSLLDVGSGRGAFLFPLLQAFPDTKVTALDILPHRVQALQRLAEGLPNLTALQGDICGYQGGRYEVVTLLEVLEHIEDVAAAVSAAVKLAERFVVVSVPSKPDNNPEHIHLLTKPILTQLFANAGCTRLKFDGVNGHLILIATVGG